MQERYSFAQEISQEIISGQQRSTVSGSPDQFNSMGSPARKKRKSHKYNHASTGLLNLKEAMAKGQRKRPRGESSDALGIVSDMPGSGLHSDRLATDPRKSGSHLSSQHSIDQIFPHTIEKNS